MFYFPKSRVNENGGKGLCNHRNGDRFTSENNMFFSLVKSEEWVQAIKQFIYDITPTELFTAVTQVRPVFGKN